MWDHWSGAARRGALIHETAPVDANRRRHGPPGPAADRGVRDSEEECCGGVPGSAPQACDVGLGRRVCDRGSNRKAALGSSPSTQTVQHWYCGRRRGGSAPVTDLRWWRSRRQSNIWSTRPSRKTPKSFAPTRRRRWRRHEVDKWPRHTPPSSPRCRHLGVYDGPSGCRGPKNPP